MKNDYENIRDNVNQTYSDISSEATQMMETSGPQVSPRVDPDGVERNLSCASKYKSKSSGEITNMETPTWVGYNSALRVVGSVGGMQSIIGDLTVAETNLLNLCATVSCDQATYNSLFDNVMGVVDLLNDMAESASSKFDSAMDVLDKCPGAKCERLFCAYIMISHCTTPNPGGKTIDLYDSAGAFVNSFTVTSDNELYIHGLKAGDYYVYFYDTAGNPMYVVISFKDDGTVLVDGSDILKFTYCD